MVYFFCQTVKELAEFIRHIENFRNFVFGIPPAPDRMEEHSDYCLYYFMFEHYKGTTIFANHQIFQIIKFPRTHVILHHPSRIYHSSRVFTLGEFFTSDEQGIECTCAIGMVFEDS